MNKMIKNLMITTVLSTCLLNQSTQALGPIPGGAYVVNDPGAYGKFEANLEALNKMITNLKQNTSEIKQMRSGLEGNYNKGIGLDQDISKIRNNIKNQIPVFHKLIANSSNSDISNYEVISKALDDTFVPSSKEMSYLFENQRNEVRQRALKDLIINSQSNLSESERSLKNAERLAQEINTTKDLAEKADLENRYLAEILVAILKISRTLDKLAVAEATSKYVGVESEVSENTKKRKGIIPTTEQILENSRKNLNNPKKKLEFDECTSALKAMGYCK
ncbi:MAG: hypothetical protein J0H68_09660 [Sphingobacteriia bacterium]|nr:hypothetical protein [Sphingobacteriia bacterium]